MAIKANTFTAFTNVGIRENLSDVISMISPTETPFTSSANDGEAPTNVYFEWQVDSLAAVSTGNAQIEGEDYDSAGLQASSVTSRIGNYVQISAKTCVISGTNERVKKAGRKSELAYQLAKRSAELKRDLEAICLTNQGAVVGNTTTARRTGSLLAFVRTNTSRGATGVDPVWTTAPTATRTDGTQRNITEALLKTGMQLVFASGGKPTTLMVGPVNKQNVSAFPGIAQTRFDVGSAKRSTIIGAADIYVSDFGNLAVVPNRFQRERDAHLLDFEYIEIPKLRNYMTEELARTGDAEKRLLLVEWGLRVKNEAALGLIADLNTALI